MTKKEYISKLKFEEFMILLNEFDIEIDAKYVVAENFRNKEAIIALVQKLLEE